MKSSFLHIILLYFLAIQVGQTQEYVTTQYYKEDGLPSDYCYNIMQDDEGFLWISNEAGLFTFDGQNFQNDIFPELINKEIIQIFKDSRGRIWMIELSGEVFYTENGKLIEFNYPFIGSTDHFVRICEDQNGHIWLNNERKPVAFGFDTETLELKYNFNSKEQQLDLLQSPGYLFHTKDVELKNNRLIVKGAPTDLEFKDFSINKFYGLETLQLNDKHIFWSNDLLFEHNFKSGNIQPILQKFHSYFEKNIQNITSDKKGNLWLATKEGFYKFSHPFSENCTVKEYFGNSNSSFVTIDNQDNIWLSTHDQGLIKMKETKIKNISDKVSNNITQVVHHLGFLIYGTSKGELVVLNEENIEVIRHKAGKKTSSVYDIKILDDTSVLVTFINKVSILDLKNLSIENLQSIGFFKHASVSPNKKHVWLNGGQNNYISSIDGKKIVPVSPELRSYSSLPISDTSAYIGSVNGLFKSNIDGSARQILPSTIQVDVRSICKSHDGSFWIGTHGEGIYIIQADTLVHHLKKLPSKHVRDIVQDGEKMWAATTNGLCLINRINQTYNVKVLDQSDGLASEQINSLFLKDDKLYAATKKGISIVDRNIEFDKVTPIAKINNIKINERDTTILSTYNLASDQRNIKFDFGGILFNKPESIQYKYMLNGLNTQWILTNNTTAQYPSLQPGKYSFLLKAKSLNSRWSELEKVDFVISRKFTEMVIFKVLVGILAFLLLLLGTVFFSHSRLRDRNLKLSQMTALRSQMNPHFIFNSLNSVQDYILRDDKVAANKYISSFSKLMRYILNSSEKEFTNLQQELDALEVYMSIESMRFDNELNYSIEISENLEPEKYLIPTMIIQPYIENAINHGLKHAIGIKKLYLRVRKYRAGLVIEIEDNGVGRVKSHSIKLKSDNTYDSKGSQINQMRIELLNKHYQKENRVSFKDIYDENKNSTGTKVEIFLQSIKFS